MRSLWMSILRLLKFNFGGTIWLWSVLPHLICVLLVCRYASSWNHTTSQLCALAFLSIPFKILDFTNFWGDVTRWHRQGLWSVNVRAVQVLSSVWQWWLHLELPKMVWNIKCCYSELNTWIHSHCNWLHEFAQVSVGIVCLEMCFHGKSSNHI